MSIGDTITVSLEGRTQTLNVIGIEKSMGMPYMIYRLMQADKVHLLYVKQGYTITEDPLEIKGHIIIFEDEVKGENFYILVHKDCVLPL